MADDFYFAHLGHQAQIGARGFAQQRLRVHLGHVERRHLVSLLARPGLFKDQGFVLAQVRSHLATNAFERLDGCSFLRDSCQ